jgi:CheY-like chemotaxis protein
MAAAAQRGARFQLILLASQMSGTDGFALAEAIGRDPANPRAGVVMLTRAGQHGNAARCRELGIAAGVSRPVNRSQLIDAIRLALTGNFRAAGASQAPAMRMTTVSSQEATGLPLRILLAEDNLVNQMVAVAILEHRGHLVKLAATGVEALAALESDEFDLVLMDAQMPEMGGIEATRVIRDKEGTRGGHIPIVALTADAMSGDRERCLAAGMDGYAAKPIRAAELFREIDRVAGLKRSAELSQQGLEASSRHRRGRPSFGDRIQRPGELSGNSA